jgi:hypothetical protein
MKKTLLSTCIAAALAVPAFAGSVNFDNPGFEAADSSGWTLHSGNWNSNSQTINDNHQGDSAVITGSGHTDSNTSGGLQTVLSGNDSFRLNNSANGAHFSTLSQTVTNYGSSDLYFGFAAVLENPHSNPHTDAETPKFSFTLTDVTTSTILNSISFDSRNAVSQGITWHAGIDTNHDSTATWMFSDWNIVHIDASTLIGDTLTLTVMAYDCALGGHGGYAYIDAFQPDPIIANSGITVNHLNVTPGSNVVTPSVAAVPEASTWVMGFLALGAVGFMVRRARLS